MGRLMRKYLVSGTTVHEQRNFVGHCARRQKNGIFLTEQNHHSLDKLIYRRILKMLLVSDLSRRNCLSHRLGRPSLRVAEKIYPVALHCCSSVPFAEK